MPTSLDQMLAHSGLLGPSSPEHVSSGVKWPFELVDKILQHMRKGVEDLTPVAASALLTLLGNEAARIVRPVSLKVAEWTLFPTGQSLLLDCGAAPILQRLISRQSVAKDDLMVLERGVAMLARLAESRQGRKTVASLGGIVPQLLGLLRDSLDSAMSHSRAFIAVEAARCLFLISETLVGRTLLLQQDRGTCVEKLLSFIQDPTPPLAARQHVASCLLSLAVRFPFPGPGLKGRAPRPSMAIAPDSLDAAFHSLFRFSRTETPPLDVISDILYGDLNPTDEAICKSDSIVLATKMMLKRIPRDSMAAADSDRKWRK